MKCSQWLHFVNRVNSSTQIFSGYAWIHKAKQTFPPNTLLCSITLKASIHNYFRQRQGMLECTLKMFPAKKNNRTTNHLGNPCLPCLYFQKITLLIRSPFCRFQPPADHLCIRTPLCWFTHPSLCAGPIARYSKIRVKCPGAIVPYMRTITLKVYNICYNQNKLNSNIRS